MTTTEQHIHRQQRGKYTVEMQNAVMKFAFDRLIPSILEFTEEIAMDAIEMPECSNECQDCEEFAMDSEDAFSAFLISKVLESVKREI